MRLDFDRIVSACRFETSRSSGPGGQHVNKTESKVQLYLKIDAVTVLSEEQKNLLRQRYANKINEAGELYLQSSVSRSQNQNKEMVLLKLRQLIETILIPPKKRVKTKPSRSSIESRLTQKKLNAAKKEHRKRI